MNPNLKDGKHLREVDRALIQMVMLELGILPMENTQLDMRRALQQLDPEQARTFRRKFRKVWRKAMAASVAHGGAPMTKSQQNQEDALKRRLGVGKQVPSRSERNARKKLVFDQLWRETIEPMLQRFENPENKKRNADAPEPAGAKATKKKTA